MSAVTTPEQAASATSSKTNFYTAAKNNPEVLERRQQRIAQLDSQVADMMRRNPGRVPDWDEERMMSLDRVALEQGKRCVMWDDQGAGFYLMLNWDWVHNRPTAPDNSEEAFQPGWWQNARDLLRPPLIDPACPEDKLAAWFDAHTMRVHDRLLERLGDIQEGSQPRSFELPSTEEYFARLQKLQPPGRS